jgi:hypothetical protein
MRLWNIYLFDVGLLVGLSVLLDTLQYRVGDHAVRRWPIPVQAALVNLALLLLILANITQDVPPPFVYQGF